MSSPSTPMSEHKWTTVRQGGDPANADSYEFVRYCEVCGMEDSCEDPLPPCVGQGNSCKMIPMSDERLQECPVCNHADYADDGNTIRPIVLGNYNICGCCGFAFEIQDAGPEPRETYWAAAKLRFDSGHHFWGDKVCKAEAEIERLRARYDEAVKAATKACSELETTEAKIAELSASLQEKESQVNMLKTRLPNLCVRCGVWRHEHFAADHPFDGLIVNPAAQ